MLQYFFGHNYVKIFLILCKINSVLCSLIFVMYLTLNLTANFVTSAKIFNFELIAWEVIIININFTYCGLVGDIYDNCLYHLIGYVTSVQYLKNILPAQYDTKNIQLNGEK